MSTAKQEPDICRGQTGTSYRLHPTPCVCDRDAPATVEEQYWTSVRGLSEQLGGK